MISQTIDIELGGLKNKRLADKGQKISVAIFLDFNSSKKNVSINVACSCNMVVDIDQNVWILPRDSHKKFG